MTTLAFGAWDFSLLRAENLKRALGANAIGAKSTSWLRDVRKVMNRRFDSNGRDRTLVKLAQRVMSKRYGNPSCSGT